MGDGLDIICFLMDSSFAFTFVPLLFVSAAVMSMMMELCGVYKLKILVEARMSDKAHHWSCFRGSCLVIVGVHAGGKWTMFKI